MSEKQFDFSIRMDKENSTPELEPFDITVTPDTKGPKSVAILMFFGGLLLILLAFGDFQLIENDKTIVFSLTESIKEIEKFFQ